MLAAPTLADHLLLQHADHLTLDGSNGSRAQNTFPAWLEGLREPLVWTFGPVSSAAPVVIVVASR